jgi:hypothetical protein
MAPSMPCASMHSMRVRSPSAVSQLTRCCPRQSTPPAVVTTRVVGVSGGGVVSGRIASASLHQYRGWATLTCVLFSVSTTIGDGAGVVLDTAC